MKALRAAAALMDGTALYFRSREGRSERLDYEALNRELQANADSVFDPAIFFTTYDAQNEGQAKFLNFLQTRLHWKVETRPVWDADPLPEDAPWERGEGRNKFIRFDAPIAFALGRLLERRDRIIVVSDSFALEPPMSAAAEYRRAEIVLAFFGSQLDRRWLPILNGGESKIKFWDLDQKSEALFGRELASSRRGISTLANLD
jgi:hypothetical protein